MDKVYFSIEMKVLVINCKVATDIRLDQLDPNYNYVTPNIEKGVPNYWEISWFRLENSILWEHRTHYLESIKIGVLLFCKQEIKKHDLIC